MSNFLKSDTVKYVGVDDKDLDLFESQYVIPNGISYNSYVIMDEKIAVMDTVDKRTTVEWLKNLTEVLGDRQPDYLVITHMEPDHSSNIEVFLDKYPNTIVVGNTKTFDMIGQFFDIDLSNNKLVVKEYDELCLGAHTLTFVMAPMIHWPEVMVAYEKTEKILFSADAFGKFSTLDVEEEWVCEARRYYFNIVGKYGVQVQALLKKLKNYEILAICPLHGPMLTENTDYYINLYDIWSKYEPEDEGIVIAYASIHGNTAAAAKKLAEMLKERGAKKVVVSDLSRADMAEVLEDAFRYNKLVLASATYDTGLFPCMENYIMHLKAKNYQKRTVALMENGTWAPMAAKHMKAMLETMKEITLVEPVVTIKSAMKGNTIKAMEELADAIMK